MFVLDMLVLGNCMPKFGAAPTGLLLKLVVPQAAFPDDTPDTPAATPRSARPGRCVLGTSRSVSKDSLRLRFWPPGAAGAPWRRCKRAGENLPWCDCYCATQAWGYINTSHVCSIRSTPTTSMCTPRPATTLHRRTSTPATFTSSPRPRPRPATTLHRRTLTPVTTTATPPVSSHYHHYFHDLSRLYIDAHPHQARAHHQIKATHLRTHCMVLITSKTGMAGHKDSRPQG